jgi:hypothetical protein
MMHDVPMHFMFERERERGVLMRIIIYVPYPGNAEVQKYGERAFRFSRENKVQ